MKLTIERLTTLTHQDLIDLAKIWPEQQPTAWQQWITEGKPLFAARFNERLLGAVKVTVDGLQGELQDLCVREVTRRRGVGLYLIEETLRQLPVVQYWQLQDTQVTAANSEAMDGFMRACGFSRGTRGWQR
ncbi:aspartate 1-decarboxylase autocleavage activator PanM [Yersinia pekkanenii]|uniref:PanD regulatory factor n=1 Tax=Yersinia pekkanenii TaxID=1288385 RepID=A0A0T9NR62_9GAMM|nr:aspartate 1-decarboxylase autocleavage activator PanM [Yersinia pekkanenii]CNH25558.1 putative acetyltransferase [Yersinia pekkanenii]CRY67216.1 putative acetyltransferase [Yersinia pekkanenii]